MKSTASRAERVFNDLAAAAWLILAAAALGVWAGAWSFDGLARHSFCPFRWGAGLDCPGCGMGRALILGLLGRFGDSWAMHPFALPFLGLWTAWMAAGFPRPRTDSSARRATAAAAAALFLLLARHAHKLLA